MSKEEMEDGIFEEIKKYCDAGLEEMDKGNLKSAAKQFNSAWKIVPDPKEKWDASSWIIGAIGDVCFHLEDWDNVKKSFEYAIVGLGGLGEPFLHLRLGQAHLELNNKKAAKDELARALMGGGPEIFEEDDPKYFEFITEFMDPPEGQDSW